MRLFSFCLLIQLACGGEGSPAGRTDASTGGLDADAERPLVFVFAGESNSGGIALNSDATETELAPRSSVQIMNLYSGTFAFETLDIGFNNLVDHAGLTDQPDLVPVPPNEIAVHGM